MKISKIFLFTAAALALCGACDDSDDKGNAAVQIRDVKDITPGGQDGIQPH